MDELPPWVVMQTQDPVIQSVITELLANGQFRAPFDSHFTSTNERPSFTTHVGDPAFLRDFNRTRPRRERVKVDENTAAASIYNNQPDGSVNSGGLMIDVDRIHDVVKQDSARARDLTRDAIIHEFAHLLPVAESRSMDSRTGDPNPGRRGASDHAVIQQENLLRGLLGLPPKDYYGLLPEK